jgi:hypothetical protein
MATADNDSRLYALDLVRKAHNAARRHTEIQVLVVSIYPSLQNCEKLRWKYFGKKKKNKKSVHAREFSILGINTKKKPNYCGLAQQISELREGHGTTPEEKFLVNFFSCHTFSFEVHTQFIYKKKLQGNKFSVGSPCARARPRS